VSKQVETAFSRAWVKHRSALELLEKSPPYWQAEIDRVIKGRGIQTLEEYVRVPRRGRALRLDAAQRALVWRLYEDYQRNLKAKELHDYHDMISIALAELTARPLERPYASVVVDEVQDITLNGLRLLRQLAGDGPNRLLLVGDGQQQVYPGGWRLSDAGIPIQGRGEVLRVNYRNRAEVLGFAQRFDAVNEVDDLDGAAGVSLQNAEIANSGGEARDWRGPERDLPGALVAAIDAVPAPLGHTALIAFQRRDLDQCIAILRKAGIAFLPLEQYEGEPDDRLKVGTVHRAKGLDFQAVLAVHFTRDAATGTAIEEETRMRRERQHLVAATRARDFLWWAVAEPDTDGRAT
jgi:superfamily I DNA/RNA helicase